MPVISMPIDYDKYIYHFTTSEIALCYILPNLELQLSSFVKANDPKESKISESIDIYSYIDGIKFCQSNIDVKFKEYLDTNCKALCFSSDYVDNETGIYTSGCNHPIMWAHYGDIFNGELVDIPIII